MKYILILGLLTLFTSTVCAQAADPDVIDLTSRLRIMDTSNNVRALNLNTNVGFQNSDSFEDIELGYYPYSGVDYSSLRFGGPLLLVPTETHIEHYVAQYGELDGDTINDIITPISGVHPFFHKGKPKSPYFDSVANGTFRFKSYLAYIIPIGIADYDGDGINDLLCNVEPQLTNDQTYIVKYKGGPRFDSLDIFPSDSIPFPPSGTTGHGSIVGKFGKHLPPMIVLAVDVKNTDPPLRKVGLIRIDSVLSKDTVEWFTTSDRDTGVISPAKLYVADITGDGIPDLLALDSTSIYIFKGGDDFGTYPLTKKNAYFTIHSPKDLDALNYSRLEDFGGTMFNCGDMTGTGIPYLMVTATETRGAVDIRYVFFYAGGKALDSKFDAFIKEYRYSYFLMDTLHTIDGRGRTACIFQSFSNSEGDYDALIYQDCEKIPHKPNPDLNNAVSTASYSSPFSAVAYPQEAKNFVKVHITGASKIANATATIYDILGRPIVSHTVVLAKGDNTDYFDLRNYPNGSYTIEIKSQVGRATTRFVIRK
ncbi:MAG: T9SS type A sorting domain-containing protein [Candidatus Kapaibacterium sp.]